MVKYHTGLKKEFIRTKNDRKLIKNSITVIVTVWGWEMGHDGKGFGIIGADASGGGMEDI